MTVETDLDRLCTLVAAQPEDVAQAVAAGDLAGWLYANWYARPAREFAPDPEPPPFDTLCAALDGVVDRAAPWSEDWVALSVGRPAAIVAGKGEVQRWAPVGRYVSLDRPGLPVVPGERVALSPVMSWTDPETGQWAAQSPVEPSEPLTRLYFNVAAGQVGHVLAAILAWLIGGDMRFRLKCPGIAANFARVDALVLYLADGDGQALGNGLGELLQEVAPLLRTGTPPLALKLAEGIALAEDPGEGHSFGQNRCIILAGAIGQALAAGGAPDRERLEQALADAGLDPAEPWRRAR